MTDDKSELLKVHQQIREGNEPPQQMGRGHRVKKRKNFESDPSDEVSSKFSKKFFKSGRQKFSLT